MARTIPSAADASLAASLGSSAGSDAAVDAVTNQPFWVLRDGLQVFWNSVGVSLAGVDAHSASLSSVADAFDVLVAESNYIESTGLFTTAPTDVDTAAGTIVARTATSVTMAEPR